MRASELKRSDYPDFPEFAEYGIPLDHVSAALKQVNPDSIVL